MILTLKGITQKGKNRIRECGDKWKVIEEQEKNVFNEYGPWLFIEPITDKEKFRWIHKNNDKDFEIISKEEV